MKYHCPCCGYQDLNSPAYKNIPQPPYDFSKLKEPPYEIIWGAASYSVCECCGFEFGFDDEPGGD